MKTPDRVSAGRRGRVRGAVGCTAATLVAMITMASAAQAATPPPPLGTAASYAVLAGSGITNTGTTTITGDIGTHPTPAITSTGTLNVNGAQHAADAEALQAKTDLVATYDSAAGAAPTSAIVADLGGQTLVPGVYHSDSSISLTGALTLDALGDPSAVFIFQAASSTLITADASSVVLAGGAQACNVFWQVGSSATLGTTSTFRGSILALTSITLTTGATMEGRALARNGAVTLDSNTITVPSCAASDAAAAAAAAAASSAQVTAVPTGSISAGDGSTSPEADDRVAILGGVFVVAATGAAVLAARRRRTAR